MAGYYGPGDLIDDLEARLAEARARADKAEAERSALGRLYEAECARAITAEADLSALKARVATFLTAYDAVVESDMAIPWDRARSDRVTSEEAAALSELRRAADLHATLTGKDRP